MLAAICIASALARRSAPERPAWSSRDDLPAPFLILSGPPARSKCLVCDFGQSHTSAPRFKQSVRNISLSYRLGRGAQPLFINRSRTVQFARESREQSAWCGGWRAAAPTGEFMGTPLARYIGVDASAAALQEARRQLVGDEGRTGFENERLANGTSASIGHPRRDLDPVTGCGCRSRAPHGATPERCRGCHASARTCPSRLAGKTGGGTIASAIFRRERERGCSSALLADVADRQRRDRRPRLMV
jgi:hypothetical protein